MKRLGICQKCGLEKIVRDHHIHGYGEENKDITAPYCYSCDLKAHWKARKEGRCKLDSNERVKLSDSSYTRRSTKTLNLSYDNIGPWVRLYTKISININTDCICIWSYFKGDHKKLKRIDE